MKEFPGEIALNSFKIQKIV